MTSEKWYMGPSLSTCLPPSRHRAFPQDQKTSKSSPKLFRNGVWDALGGHFVTKMAPSLLKIAQNWSLGASKLDPGDLLGPHGAPFGTMWDPLGLPMDPLWVPRCKKTKKSGSFTAQCG